MQPFQCDLAPQRQETHRTTHTGTSIVTNHIEGTKRPQPQPPHKRGSFHRRLQPLYTEKHTLSCSGFLPNSPLPFLTASHHHHFPSWPPPFVHFPSSPPPFLTTSHRPHLPSSPFPFIITSLRHHFPSSPLPFRTISLRHHFPSSPLPFVTTSHRHHFPSSPLPFVTTSHRHHFPSLPLPIVTTSLRHHFPSSPLPFVTTSHRYHFPSSPPPIVTTLCHSFLILCDIPPFIKVNSIDSYSFVMYCYVMYHPSLRSIS